MKKLVAFLMAIVLAAGLAVPAAAFGADHGFNFTYIDGLEAIRYPSLYEMYRHMEELRYGAVDEGGAEVGEDVLEFLLTADKIYFPKGSVADYQKISAITVAPTYVEMTIETGGRVVSLRQYISDEAGKTEYDALKEKIENGDEGSGEITVQGDEVNEILTRTAPASDGFETCYYLHQSDGGYMVMGAPGEVDKNYAKYVGAEVCNIFPKNSEGEAAFGGYYAIGPYDGYEGLNGWLYLPDSMMYINEKGLPASGAIIVGGDSAYKFDEDGKLSGRHTGWVKDGDDYRYAVDGSLVTRTWIRINGMRKYYINGDGVMTKGRAVIDGNEYEFGENGAVIDPWGIGMGIKNVTETGCTLVFSQAGGEETEFITGVGCTVQRFENGKWQNVEYISDDIAINAEALIIRCGRETKLDINWEYWYGPLEPGDYRAKKTVDRMRGPGDFDSREYFAYFTVKK